MKKSMFALALTAALLLSLFCGCGSSADSETAEASTSETAQVSESAQPEEATQASESEQVSETETAAAEETASEEAEPSETAAEEEASQEEAAAESSAAESAIQFPLDETQTLTYWHDLDSRILTYIDSGVIDDAPGFVAAEEATNVHISHVTASQDAESVQFNLMVASGDYTDLMRNAASLYSKGSIAAMDDAVIIDLSDYLEEYAPNFIAALDSVDGYSKNVTTDDGRIPTFTTIYAAGQDPSQGLWVRKDLLDELGLEIPATYDEFTEMLRAFKDAGIQEPLYMNPTGVLPKNVLAAGYQVAVDMNFGSGAAATEPFYQVDGEVKFGALEEGWLDYIEMVRDWYAEGLISSDFVSNTGNAMDGGFMSAVTSGQTAVFCAPTMLIEMLAETGQDANPDFEVVAIPDMVQQEGDSLHFGMANATAMKDGLSISTTSENTELAVAWCDYWYSDEGRMLATWGQEGVTYELDENGEPQWTEFVTDNPDGIAKMDVTTLYTISVGSVNYMPTDTTGMAQWAIDALSIWMEGKDDAYDIPSTATFTSEESEQYNNYMGEISTYYNEYVLKYITGAEGTESYDAFVQRLKDMGIEACIDLKQAELDRYLSR